MMARLIELIDGATAKANNSVEDPEFASVSQVDPAPSKPMSVKSPPRSTAKRVADTGATPNSSAPEDKLGASGASAVPFKVTAFAAAVLQPPAISDAVEDEPVFDKSKAKRVVKRKRT